MENKRCTLTEAGETMSTTQVVANGLAENTNRNMFLQNVVIKTGIPRSNVQNVQAQLKVEKKAEQIDYIFQPNQEEIINGMIPKSLKVQLFKAVLESNASENGARMTAMDKATENAGELLKDLRLTYNRTRQAAITKEILEIVAGAEALKSA